MANRSLVRRQFLIAGLIGSILASGCTQTVTHRVARFQPSDGVEETTLVVPEPGVWKVKVRGPGGDDYHGIDGTERYLQVGDVVGFRNGDDGVVYALVNDEQIPLALTPEHRRVVWHASLERPSHFGEGLGDAVGSVMVIGALGLLFWAAASVKDECEHGRRGHCRRCR